MSATGTGKTKTGSVKGKPVAEKPGRMKPEVFAAKWREASKIAPKHARWLGLAVLLGAEKRQERAQRERVKDSRKGRSGSGRRRGGQTS